MKRQRKLKIVNMLGSGLMISDSGSMVSGQGVGVEKQDKGSVDHPCPHVQVCEV